MSDTRTHPIDFVKSVHVQLTNKTRELSKVSLVGLDITSPETYVVVLKVRAQDRPAEFTHIRYDEASAKRLDCTGCLVEQRWTYLVPSSVQEMK